RRQSLTGGQRKATIGYVEHVMTTTTNDIDDGLAVRPPEPAAWLREEARRQARGLLVRLRELRGEGPAAVYERREAEGELRWALTVARGGVPSWAEIDAGNAVFIGRQRELR